MEEKLVPIYDALTVDDAQRLADILNERGVESFVENTDSPLYSMTQGRASHVVLVHKQAVASAREIARRFAAEWHPGVPRDEQQYEETGFELPDDPRPSEDSPNEELDLGMERRDRDRPGPESPEVEELITEDPKHEDVDWREHRIVSIGPDRGLTQDPDIDAEDVQDQRIDQLHLDVHLDEPETGTPSANLDPEDVRRREE